jgi:hypothetical protein
MLLSPAMALRFEVSFSLPISGFVLYVIVFWVIFLPMSHLMLFGFSLKWMFPF